jgi:predicted transcriptional regulator
MKLDRYVNELSSTLKIKRDILEQTLGTLMIEMHKTNVKVSSSLTETASSADPTTRTINIGLANNTEADRILVLVHELAHLANAAKFTFTGLEARKYGPEFYIALKLADEYEAYHSERRITPYIENLSLPFSKNYEERITHSPEDLVNWRIGDLFGCKNYKQYYRRGWELSWEKREVLHDEAICG